MKYPNFSGDLKEIKQKKILKENRNFCTFWRAVLLSSIYSVLPISSHGPLSQDEGVALHCWRHYNPGGLKAKRSLYIINSSSVRSY